MTNFTQKVKKNLNNIIGESVLSGVFFVVTGAMFGSVFLIAFARKIGMSDFQIAVLAAAPQFANMLQFLASFAVENYIHRKRFFIITALLARILWIIAMAIPLVILKNYPSFTIWLFILFIALSNIFAYSAGTAWISWMKDIVPNKLRGKFFSKRNFYIGIFTMIAPYIAGRLFDKYTTINYYVVIFSLLAFMSLIGVMFMTKVEDTFVHSSEKISFKDIFRLPLKTKNFIYFLLFSIFTTIGISGMIPFLQLYFLEGLLFTNTTIGFLLLISGGIAVVSNILWGNLSTRIGHKNTLIFAVAGIALLPFLWVLTNKSNGYLLSIFIQILAGFVWAGMNLAYLNLLFAISPKKRNTAYVALFSMVNGLSGFIAPIIGAEIINLAKNIFSIPAVKVLFVVSGLLRIVGFYYLTKVKEFKAVPFRFRALFSSRYQ